MQVGGEGAQEGRTGAERRTRGMGAREVGAEGERLATTYLRRRGYEILERNWTCTAGEVDIVCEIEGTVVLVEVKTRLWREVEDGPLPELAVDGRKRARYRRLALVYLCTHPEVEAVRFDVVAISIVGRRCAQVHHLMGAFAWDD